MNQTGKHGRKEKDSNPATMRTLHHGAPATRTVSDKQRLWRNFETVGEDVVSKRVAFEECCEECRRMQDPDGQRHVRR
jgi:hypothetical protein